METAFHVNGTAEAKVGLGASGALQLLGHSINGVDIDLRPIKFPVYTDAAGGDGGVPATYQKIGQIALVRGEFVVYDEAVMSNVRAGPEVFAAETEGTMIYAGTIMDTVPPGGSGNHGFYRLLILSPGDVPWNFVSAHLLGSPVRLSTRVSVWRLQWEAIHFTGTANSTLGSVLYNRVTS
jgi:hypothetical protein